MYFKKEFLGFLILFVSFKSISDECADFDNSIKNVIYFVNGVGNSAADMSSSIKEIRAAVGNTLENRYRIAENRSDGIDKDFYQAWLNRQNSPDPEKFWEQVKGGKPTDLDPDSQRLYADAIAVSASVEYSRSEDLRKMVDNFLSDLRSGKKVILVAHSQGNFYANAAYRYIAQNWPSYTDSIGIVAVASPAPIVEGNGFLTQNAKDKLLFSIVSLAYQVMAANVDFKGEDLLDHGFLTTYMLPQNARARIVSHIRQTISKLDEPISPCDKATALVEANTASEVKAFSARLNGRLLQGENAKVWFVNKRGSSAVKCTDTAAVEPRTLTAATNFNFLAKGLESKSSYYFLACGRGTNGVINSSKVKVFSTPRNEAKVSAPRLKVASADSLLLESTILEGERVNTGIIWSEGSRVNHNCELPVVNGRYSAGDIIETEIRDLKPNTSYKVSSCATASDGNHLGGSIIVSTNNIPLLPCGSAAFQGDSSGLAVRYSLGGQSGRASIYFNAFQIPDGLEIYRSGTNVRLFSTGQLISGSIRSSFVATGSDYVDIVVTGNSDSDTRWELEISCPQ